MTKPRDLAERFWSKVDRTGSGCWEWTASRGGGGYGEFRHGPMWKAHRMAWTLTHGPIPPGKIIRHACDNPPCCRPSHLLIGTQLDNKADAIARGRATPPPWQHRVTLTDADKATIRARYSFRRVTYGQLAEEYGVHRETVARVVRQAK